MRKPALSILFVCLAMFVGGDVTHAAARPNILFIAVDDLRPELGCYGNQEIKSPHIDRLAGRGVVFTRAYCQQAVCSPSRTSLLTGLRPDSTGVYDLSTHFRNTVSDVVTLPQHFKNHGYCSLGMGKIYHGGLDDRASWSEPHRSAGRPMYLNEATRRRTQRKRIEARKSGLKGIPLYNASTGPPFELADVPDDAYADGALTNMAIESLRKLAKTEQPFFLAVGYLKPHLPFNAPKRYWDLYDRDKITPASTTNPPKDCPRVATSGWHELRAYEGMPESGPVTTDQANQLKHGYYACVSYVDAQIGMLLGELDRLELTSRTIVVLWGDHGWKLGDYGMWCKHTNFELDTRVPLVVSAPNATGNGRSSPALVEFVDIYPTLCELSGIPLADHLEGTSFKRQLDSPDAAGDAFAMSQYPRGRDRMGYSMRTDRYRITLWVNRKRLEETVAIELYDHQDDPGETVNVASDPGNAELIKKLTADLKRANDLP